MIERLMRAGMDVARLNFSHGTHDDHALVIKRIREASARLSKPIGILADLQGPKIRTGLLKGRQPVQLVSGQRFTISIKTIAGTAEGVSTTYKRMARDVSRGDRILLGDGLIELHVLSTTSTEVHCKVINGGLLGEHKGINLPGVKLKIPAVTPKDHKDLIFALEQGANFIAVSFVRDAKDVLQAKKAILQAKHDIPVIAKLEKPEAIDHLDEILNVSDGVMVARGDLGVEMPLERVPGLQKQITRAARKAGKPVVVATQMLESMINSPMPTRAEVSDVATAVFEGADAVMLSAESASGAYPVEAVQTMDRIACSVEDDELYHSIIEAQRGAPEKTTPDAIMAAVHEVTQTIEARAIVCWTKSGITAMRAARERSQAPIIAPTPSIDTARRLCLVWGTHSVITEDIRDFDDMVKRAGQIARQEGFAQAGERIVITAGVPLGTTGATNMLRVAFVTDED
jgi:pyruvate kinase